MDKISASLSETIENSDLDKVNQDLEDILVDTAENILDESSHILDEVPIIKTLLTIPKVFKGISNYQLTKKIIRFLMQLEPISIEERKRFLEDLDSEKKKDIIENLMLVLEKHDNYHKSEIQGKIFRALLDENINIEEYNALTYATSNIDINNLTSLINYYKNVSPGRTSPGMKTELLYHFSFLQLISVDNSRVGTLDSGAPEFKHNDLGAKFVGIIDSK